MSLAANCTATAADDEYGMERLDACLRSAGVSTADELHARVLADVKGFIGRAPLNDDLTLMVVRRLPGGPAR